MNPLALIPASYQLAVRAAALVLLVALGAVVGWTINGWRLGTDLQALKAEHAQTVAAAAAGALAAQRRADADHQALAGKLASQSSTFLADLTRREHEIDSLRPAVAAGTRVVRVAATCPASPGGVPEAASGGRVDPAAGAELAPADGQAVLDLRAGILRLEGKLAACQAAAVTITGQRSPAD